MRAIQVPATPRLPQQGLRIKGRAKDCGVDLRSELTEGQGRMCQAFTQQPVMKGLSNQGSKFALENPTRYYSALRSTSTCNMKLARESS